MQTIVAESLQDLYRSVLTTIIEEGKEVEVRGLMTKEIHPCLMHIINPKKRTLLYPKRGNNPFSTLAETLWVLAGRNDIKFLEMFLPRAADFSDDGKVWRAGYGPRMRKWQYTRYEYSPEVVEDFHETTDQIEFIVKQLIKDSNSRQAVISIWDPRYENTVEKTKDYPCCNWIHFMIRDGALDCTVVVRSNDAIWGLSSINVYEWTVLQEILANILGIPVGQYYQMSDSLHLYQDVGKNNNWESAKNMASAYIDLPNLPTFEFAKDSYTEEKLVNDSIAELKTYLSCVEKCCETLLEPKNFCSIYKDLNQIYYLLDWYIMKDVSKKDNWKDVMNLIPFCDLKVACNYWVRKNLFKEKDTGQELIDKCIDECKM
jgi:thymidylate synthase